MSSDDLEQNSSRNETRNESTTRIEDAVPSGKRKPIAFYLSILMLGIIGFLTALEATSLAVALPQIADELQGSTLEAFWVSISFTLAIAITQPLYSSTSDILGRKLLLYIAMVLFTVGSIVFATAKSMAIAILGRLIMGFGGGGMDVLQVIILSDITTLRERPLYMSIEATFITVGAILGPIMGGAFAQDVSWRWIGWINLPFLGMCFILTIFFLRIKPIELDFRAKIRSLDWIGMGLFAVSVTAIALPLSWADSLYPWSSWRTLVPLLLGIAVLIAFAVYEKGVKEAVIPYRIFGNRTAVAGIGSGFVQGLIMYTVLLYLPLSFQAVFLEGPLRAAISTLPFAASLISFSVISGLAVNLLRQYRMVLWSGWILCTTFIGLLTLVNRTTSRAEVYSFQVLAGIGIGTCLTVTAIPMQASVKRVDDTGLAAGMLVIFRLFGALIGLTIGSAAFNGVFNDNIRSLNLPQEVLGSLNDSQAAVSLIRALKTLPLDPVVLDSITDVYAKSFRAIWITLTCVSGAGLLMALFIKELSLEKDDVGRQGFETSKEDK